ncbi:MAG TPA: subclass B3 metallo-beta-lactamase [Verrucomicrobiae bacterium]|nr:subclass B3 metallo-beta-lactamase [Verrucomicrobiae bacterium]
MPSQAQRLPPGWGQPFPPFHIAGNLYYVGDQDLASYIVVTNQGIILINSGVKEDVPLIEKGVEQLGFHYKDIKILLISHAHYDHAEGSAQIIKDTHARYYVMEADVPTVESGGKDDFQYGHNTRFHFPAAKVDRILHDGDNVELGGSVLVAHLTAGHTKGTTTWTTEVTEGGKVLHVVIVGSPNVNPGYKLVGNKQYPHIADDYKQGFAVMKNLPCDIFLGSHGSYFGLKEKYAKWSAGDKNAFIDPTGYRTFVEQREEQFELALKKQQ